MVPVFEFLGYLIETASGRACIACRRRIDQSLDKSDFLMIPRAEVDLALAEQKFYIFHKPFFCIFQN